MAAKKGTRAGTPATRPAPNRKPPRSSENPSPPSRLHLFALLAVFVVAALFSLRELGSPDIGFHLKTGDYILSGHGVPRTDPFTETMKGHRYTDTSWGYDVLVALVFRLGGVAALVSLHAGLVLLLFFILYRTSRLLGSDPTSLIVCLLAGIVATEVRFEVRPEIVSYTLFALLLHLLHRHAEGKPVRLWTIPLLMLAWSNLHSLYVLGWLAMAAFVAGLWWARGRLDRPLARWCLIGALTALLTPYGWRTMVFPFTLLTRFGKENPFAQTISEFVSPFALRTLEQFPFFPELPIWTYRVLALVSVLAAIVFFRQRRFWMVLLWLPVFYLSAKMLRNIPLFVVAMLPGLAAAFSLERVLVWFRTSGRRRVQLVRSVTALVLLVSAGIGLRVVTNAYYIDTRRPERLGLGWSTTRLPLETAAYARGAALPGTMLNHLNLGGYFMWALPGPVFIDGRLEVVGEQFYRYYLDVFHSGPALERAVADQGIGWIVFPFLQEMDLLRRLTKDSRWMLSHYDPIAAVFVRRAESVSPPASLVPPPAVTLEELPGLAGRPRSPSWKRWLQGFISKREYPFAEYQRGLFHTIRGEWGLAAGWLAEATRKSEGAYYETYLNLAQVLDQLGEQQRAGAAFRVVLQEDPGNRIALKRIGSR